MSDAPFFVPWLRLNARLKRRALVAGAAFLLLSAGLGVFVATRQSEHGKALSPRRPVEGLVGIAHAKPYPHLVSRDASGQATTWLFVHLGKGADALDPTLDGQLVRASGTEMQRAGTRLLAGPTLEPLANEEVDADPLPSLRDLAVDDRGVHRLEGEIVDAKCHLGAMQPGRGATHRACAQMCIEGGVPPLYVVEDGEGRERHLLLVSPEGTAVHDLVLPFVALPVAIEGRVFERGGLLHLEVQASTIESL